MQAEHSKNFPSDPWGHSGTTSYTGIAEVEPGVVLLACECTLHAYARAMLMLLFA